MTPDRHLGLVQCNCKLLSCKMEDIVCVSVITNPDLRG